MIFANTDLSSESKSYESYDWLDISISNDQMKSNKHENFTLEKAATTNFDGENSVDEVVGIGTFGIIIKVEQEYGEVLAKKQLRKQKISNKGLVLSDYTKQIGTEIACWHHLSSIPNAVSFLGYQENQDVQIF